MLAAQLGRLVESIGGEWSVFPFENQTTMGEELDKHLSSSPVFPAWVVDKDAVIFLEVLKRRWIQAVKRVDATTVFVPMWERLPDDDLTRHMDHVICPSVHCFNLMQDRGFINAVCWPWALDTPSTEPEPYDGSRIRLLHNASLPRPRRNTVKAIEIFLGLLGRGFDVELLVKAQQPFDNVGGFKPGTFKYEIQAIKHAEKAAGDRFRYDVGVVSHEENMQLYREADLLLHTTSYDGIGLMVQEAISCRLPVVCLNVPSVNEWVHPWNGIKLSSDMDETMDVLSGLTRKQINTLRSGCDVGLFQRYASWQAHWRELLLGFGKDT